jgi:hypothetical protein
MAGVLPILPNASADREIPQHLSAMALVAIPEFFLLVFHVLLCRTPL